jgi:hypothetical protein
VPARSAARRLAADGFDGQVTKFGSPQILYDASILVVEDQVALVIDSHGAGLALLDFTLCRSISGHYAMKKTKQAQLSIRQSDPNFREAQACRTFRPD